MNTGINDRAMAADRANGATRASALAGYLDDCREIVLEEIRRIIPDDGRYGEALYDLMLDYPLRSGKALRPALCIAACRGLGGRLDAVARTAAVLELYHNAFLIHDDIEDESLMRRGKPTLHRAHGVPIAVNVGDAMLSLTLEPLLANVAAIGLGPALKILRRVSTMSRESVEGQAIELEWVRSGACALSDADYFEMVLKKTGWYSFITPLQLGALCAGATDAQLEALRTFGEPLAIAFQIRDDVLNLEGELDEYGKEIAGDIWEGKRTLMLLHVLRCASAEERERIARVMALDRPSDAVSGVDEQLLDQLQSSGDLTAAGRRRLADVTAGSGARFRTEVDVAFVLDCMRRYDSATYASNVAESQALAARDALGSTAGWLPVSPHRRLLEQLVDYVLERSR